MVEAAYAGDLIGVAPSPVQRLPDKYVITSPHHGSCAPTGQSL
jgi:hypothetical protein